MIHLDQHTYQAAFAGESIQLLPKEFALFRFLYENAGRSFSRDELLEAVWPLEAPSDRTVDDHIYRVRKKMAKWSHLLRVETIRGQGYKLIRHAKKQQDSPLLEDEQFAVDINRILSKYHGLGMGAAMQLLATHRDILSLPGDPYYDTYLHFVRGDFEWILTTDSINYWQKLSYAAFIHATIQLQPQASLRYFERLITEGDMLSREWQYDLRINVIFHLLKSGMLVKAQQELDAIRQNIADLNSPSFTANFLIKEIHLQLQEGQMDAAAFTIQECENLLAQHPIQRERGALLVVKALFLYQQGSIASARQTLDEGMETTRHTQFIPHLLTNLNTALLYLRTHVRDETYRLKYERQWDLLAIQYRFDELLVKAEHLLVNLL
ncbi:transcriptional regulator [Paenibacillus taihuensis]|uniref:Transcriptional regulator n=1 Tax=Paenibacillus taihuensis TaxID=1156355 RepID=A0A3D9SEZ9_9BACL|nr:winged helix-turn-helix domain-containing protein [Paenibacillus taihuensis]REE93167.1 transcriptional regulator [Paenibacillus taihuensis]